MNSKKNILLVIVTTCIAIILFISIFVIIPAFTSKQDPNLKNDSLKNNDTIIIDRKNNPKHDTLLIIDYHNVFIKTSAEKIRGTFLVLHGWNFPADEWCNKTDLCSKATQLGFHVVLPDMGKGIYQDQNYTETIKDWLAYPTRSWLSDTLIPKLRKEYGLLMENDSNYIVGLSTGARGVALVLLDYPDLFKGAGALSGDYDQAQMKTDNLMKAYYGSYSSQTERWETIDNPIYRIKEYHTPIYLGHGTNDKVVPISQTLEFYDSLKKYHPELPVKLNTPAAEHTYEYWNSEVDNMIDFFKLK